MWHLFVRHTLELSESCLHKLHLRQLGMHDGKSQVVSSILVEQQAPNEPIPEYMMTALTKRATFQSMSMHVG